MILEFDAGNTRIKWRLMNETDTGLVIKEAEGVAMAKNSTPSVFIDLGVQLDRLPVDDISRVKVSSVREDVFEEIFSPLILEKWNLQAEYAEVTESCCGVTNSYEDVGSMGIDRWLSMLAAYDSVQGACCVVDCGTAITLDLLDADGLHRGGYIVPGLYLMQEVLGRKARVLKDDIKNARWNPSNISTRLGLNTREAISNGIVSMSLGLIERIKIQQADKGAEVNWFVTGGDADIVSSLMTWEHEVIPDLVMDGLAMAMK